MSLFFHFRNNNIRYFVDIWTAKLQMPQFSNFSNLVTLAKVAMHIKLNII